MQVRRFVPACAIGLLAAALFLTTDAAAQQTPAISPRSEDPNVFVNIRTEGQAHRQVIDFSATPNSFVVLIRVNNYGTVEVLYPSTPSIDRALVRSEKPIRVSSLSNPKAFYSQGSVFAFVSNDPFDFSKVADGSGWNSLHLASYSGISAESVARTFLDEIADRSSRVVMTDPMFSNAVLGTKSSEPLSWLTEFRSKGCPTLATRIYGQSGTSGECVLQGFRMPARTTTGGSSQPKSRLDPMKQN